MVLRTRSFGSKRHHHDYRNALGSRGPQSLRASKSSTARDSTWKIPCDNTTLRSSLHCHLWLVVNSRATTNQSSEEWRHQNGISLYADHRHVLSEGNIERTVNFLARAVIKIKATCLLQEKGVRILVIAVGQFATKNKYRAVLKRIAGENIIFVDDYRNLTRTTDDITSIICREYDHSYDNYHSYAFIVLSVLYVVYAIEFFNKLCNNLVRKSRKKRLGVFLLPLWSRCHG